METNIHITLAWRTLLYAHTERFFFWGTNSAQFGLNINIQDGEWGQWATSLTETQIKMFQNAIIFVPRLLYTVLTWLGSVCVLCVVLMAMSRCWVWPASTVLRMEDADWLELTTSLSHSGWWEPGEAPGLPVSADLTNRITFNRNWPCLRELWRWDWLPAESIRWDVINWVMTGFDN